jgi:hypothetical protein
MRTRKKRVGTSPLKSLGAGAALTICVIYGAQAGTISIGSRDSSQTLSFSNAATFGDALLTGSSVFGLSGNSGDSYSFNYLEPHGATGFSATGSADFNVSAPIFSSGIPNDTQSFAVTALNTPSSGALTVNGQLGVNVAPSGAIETLNTGVSGGYNYLDEFYDPQGNQTTGQTFTFTVDIAGNYSASGVGTGRHQLVSLNPAWTVTQNFAFNGTDTIFSADINNYDPSTDRIGLEYQIYGSPVPLPASGWLLFSSLSGLNFLRRRRSLS